MTEYTQESNAVKNSTEGQSIPLQENSLSHVIASVETNNNQIINNTSLANISALNGQSDVLQTSAAVTNDITAPSANVSTSTANTDNSTVIAPIAVSENTSAQTSPPSTSSDSAPLVESHGTSSHVTVVATIENTVQQPATTSAPSSNGAIETANLALINNAVRDVTYDTTENSEGLVTTHASCYCPACMSTGSQDPNQTGNPGPQSTDPYYISALKSGTVWTNNGTGLNLNYKFWTALPSYYSGSDAEARNFQAFSADMRTATRDVLAQLSSFINVTFTEVTQDSQAQLGFAQARLSDSAGAWAYYPGNYSKAGDVWTNNLYASSTQNVAKGTYGFFVLLHEIGHALGLKHSFQGGVTLSGDEDTSRFTVMSYTWPIYTQTYMMYDIAALQSLYGANTSFNAGNTTYTLQAGVGATVWDGGGVDTLDGSALSANLTLRLESGSLSSIGGDRNFGIAFGAVIENARGGSGNDNIYGNSGNNNIQANGGNDTVYTDAGNDTLDGGVGGSDTVIYNDDLANFQGSVVNGEVRLSHATFGNDVLTNFEVFRFNGANYTLSELQAAFGGTTVPAIRVQAVTGASTYSYISNITGVDFFTATELNATGFTGNLFRVSRTSEELNIESLVNSTTSTLRITADAAGSEVNLSGIHSNLRVTFNGGAGHDRFTSTGVIGGDTAFGGDGNDFLAGGFGNDFIYGDNGNDTLYGDDGDDRLYGRNDNDTLYGGNGNDTALGEAGDDIIYGDIGNDVLGGGAGNDTLYGGSGNDILFGDIGNDILVFGAGVDSLTGSGGIDTFRIDVIDSNIDNVTDFRLLGLEADRIDISDVLIGFDTLSDNINDFARLSVASTGRGTLQLNADGMGSDWISVVTFAGSSFTGVTINTLFGRGQLIADD